MINRLLISCLKRNKRLIIPTLGAIIRKKIEGVGSLLVFVPFLNKDDGVLLNAIKEWAATDNDDEAKEIMNEYISAIKESLKNRGQYIIEGMGVLKYDQNNILYLAKESEANHTLAQPETDFTVENIVKNEVEEENTPEAEPKTEVFNNLIDKVLAEEETPLPIDEVNSNNESSNSNNKPAEPNSQEVTESIIDNEPEENNEGIVEEQELKEEIKEEAKEEVAEVKIAPRNYGSIKTGVGARYFSQSTSSDDSGEERRTTLNSLYHNNPEIKPTENRRADGSRRDPKKLNSIYNTPSKQDEEKESVKTPQTTKAPVNTEVKKTKTAQNKKYKTKGKNNDIVLIIAIIAVLITIAVLVYGYIYGNELPLPEPLIENTTVDSQNH